MQHRFNNMAAPMKILQFIEIEPKFDAISGTLDPSVVLIAIMISFRKK